MKMSSSFIPDLGDLIWLILPLLILQLALMGIGLWEWNKKKENLGTKKVLWLLIILIFSIAGPIFFLLYSQRFDLPRKREEFVEDDWEK